MKKYLSLLFLGIILSSGCEKSTREQPLPTVDAEGKLTIPDGYTPEPRVDLSRVDCQQYLAMNSEQLRNEIKSLCLSSKTAEERERNPYCQTHEITDHCTRNGKSEGF